MGAMLEGLRVIELASDRAAFTGKLLADLGADVIVVEPPGGHPTRSYGPFLDGNEGPDTCLWWWYYNTSKRSVELDLTTSAGAAAFRALVRGADLVLEGEDPGRLDALGLDHPERRADHPELIWVSVTPFGRRLHETGGGIDAPMTDLTILAQGGVVWNNGYDDRSLPPVRPLGEQAQHIAGIFAACGALIAVLHRDDDGVGQHVDVSMVAAANVTTEQASVFWLVAQTFVHRQTGRHAAPMQTLETQILASDGHYVCTGFPPHTRRDFEVVLDWLVALGLDEEFPETFFLQFGIDRGGVSFRDLGSDPEMDAIYGAGREALTFIAAHITAYEFFIGAQERDLQVGVIYAPEEAMADPHYAARGFPTPVHHPELDRDVTYPGAPFHDSDHGWAIRRRPPLVGEHTAEVLAEVGLADAG
jgi:crotonobetainyl-CoA:carnitine CoA-transferase CaiB-like acyl-CoA transferase